MSITATSFLETLRHPFAGDPLKVVTPLEHADTTLQGAKQTAQEALDWAITAPVRAVCTPFVAAGGLAVQGWEKPGAVKYLAAPAGLLGGFVGGIFVGAMGATIDTVKAGGLSLLSVLSVGRGGVEALNKRVPDATTASANGVSALTSNPRVADPSPVGVSEPAPIVSETRTSNG